MPFPGRLQVGEPHEDADERTQDHRHRDDEPGEGPCHGVRVAYGEGLGDGLRVDEEHEAQHDGGERDSDATEPPLGQHTGDGRRHRSG